MQENNPQACEASWYTERSFHIPDVHFHSLVESSKVHIKGKVVHPFQVSKQQWGSQKTKMRHGIKPLIDDVMGARTSLSGARTHLLGTR